MIDLRLSFAASRFTAAAVPTLREALATAVLAEAAVAYALDEVSLRVAAAAAGVDPEAAVDRARARSRESLRYGPPAACRAETQRLLQRSPALHVARAATEAASLPNPAELAGVPPAVLPKLRAFCEATGWSEAVLAPVVAQAWLDDDLQRLRELPRSVAAYMSPEYKALPARRTCDSGDPIGPAQLYRSPPVLSARGLARLGWGLASRGESTGVVSAS